MDEGMIIEKAETKEFFANPKSDRTKAFFKPNPLNLLIQLIKNFLTRLEFI